MRKRKAALPKTVGILADLHCGSRWGMLSPDDPNHKQNVGQRYLWECWEWLANNWPELDLLVLNGDLIDGCQYKSKGTGVLTTDYSEQSEMAVRCVKYMVDHTKPRKIVRTSGTPYHEGHFGALKQLDGILEIPAQRVAIECDPLDIDLGGTVLNVKHHPEGSAALYVGTVQDRETIWATIAEARQGIPKAQILVRSHLHMDGRFDGQGKTHVLTPCWQLQSAYAKKTRFYRWHPTIGAILLRRDPLDDNGFTVVKTTFPLPKRKAVSYAQL